MLGELPSRMAGLPAAASGGLLHPSSAAAGRVAAKTASAATVSNRQPVRVGALPGLRGGHAALPASPRRHGPRLVAILREEHADGSGSADHAGSGSPQHGRRHPYSTPNSPASGRFTDESPPRMRSPSII